MRAPSLLPADFLLFPAGFFSKDARNAALPPPRQLLRQGVRPPSSFGLFGKGRVPLPPPRWLLRPEPVPPRHLAPLPLGSGLSTGGILDSYPTASPPPSQLRGYFWAAGWPGLIQVPSFSSRLGPKKGTHGRVWPDDEARGPLWHGLVAHKAVPGPV